MKDRFPVIPLIIFFASVVISSCADKKHNPPDVMSGIYWKNQAINDILPAWTKHSIDTRNGAFHTTLDSSWTPSGDQHKFPSMISRHLFSYSSAYLLTGKEEYIKIADDTFNWLISKAWDKEHGGWYDELDETGNPVKTSKSVFVQVYSITGLAMYYFATHDTAALRYIEESNNLLEQKAWDKNAGGYFNIMNRDWSVNDSAKSFSAQITPVSGYLVYLYQATRDEKYIAQMNRILGITTEKMIDPETGWVLEDFDNEWNYFASREGAAEINIGHNIEAAWMLLKSFLITGNNQHLKSAMSLQEKLLSAGVFKENGIWLTTAGRLDYSLKGPETYWWVQAYGNMFSLYLYHSTGDEKYLNDFREGAAVWDSVFLDRNQGDTFFSTGSDGTNKNGLKANQYKTSYHSIEHCLLNMLCLDLWVNDKKPDLYFRIRDSKPGDKLYPLPLEDKDAIIEKVIINGMADNKAIISNQGIDLPSDHQLNLKITIGHKQ